MQFRRAIVLVLCMVTILFLEKGSHLNAQTVPPNQILLQLTGITILQTGDDVQEAKYRIKVLTGAEAGPFDLGNGESDSFSPGLPLLVRNANSNEGSTNVDFDVQVNENDGDLRGNWVDRVVVRTIHARISRPGSTMVTRQITIPSNAEGGRPGKILLQFRLISGS